MLGATVADDWGVTVPPFLQIGDLSNNYVEVTDIIPTELELFYTAHYGGSVLSSMIRFVDVSGSNVNYYYMIIRGNTLVGTIWAMGWVDNTAPAITSVHEGYVSVAASPNPLIEFGVNSPIGMTFGTPGNGTIWSWFMDTIFVGGQTNYDFQTHANNGADLFIDGISAPRTMPAVNIHRSAMDILSVGSAVPAGAAELTILTVPSIPYRAGRAYAIDYMLNAQATVAGGRPLFHVRQTNNVGTLLGGGSEIPVTAVNRPALAYGKVLFCNASGVDITDNIVLTLADAGGVGGNVQALRPTGSVGYFGPPTDIGAAINFVNPTGLVPIPTLV